MPFFSVINNSMLRFLFQMSQSGRTDHGQSRNEDNNKENQENNNDNNNKDGMPAAAASTLPEEQEGGGDGTTDDGPSGPTFATCKEWGWQNEQ